MPDLVTIKQLHVAFAVLSIALFLARFCFSAFWLAFPSTIRRLPHVIDTLLLGSGLILASKLNLLSGFSWLWVKLLLVVLYVISAYIALRAPARTTKKNAFSVFTFVTMSGIVAIAITNGSITYL